MAARIVNGGWNLLRDSDLEAAGVWEGNYSRDSSPGDVYRETEEPEAPSRRRRTVPSRSPSRTKVFVVSRVSRLLVAIAVAFSALGSAIADGR